MQRIELQNFGPIKECILDVDDFMIFIGPQASGCFQNLGLMGIWLPIMKCKNATV